MEISQEQLTQIINEAVTQATTLAFNGIEEKIKTAMEIGATIGATTGAEAGAQAALRAAERERQRYRKDVYDARFHNTKLLLKHYRALNAHYQHAIFDVSTAEEEDKSFSEILAVMNSTIVDEALYIESIKQSCARTKIIMSHVNRMLKIYESMCNASDKLDEQRHWRILYSLYIAKDPMSADEIAARETIDKRTVYKNFDSAASDLTVLLFGVGALEK